MHVYLTPSPVYLYVNSGFARYNLIWSYPLIYYIVIACEEGQRSELWVLGIVRHDRHQFFIAIY